MTDETTVFLTVLSVHEDTVESFFTYRSDDERHQANRTIYEFSCVNQGTLPFLDQLETFGIAFDSEWSEGNGYTGGCLSCRFTSEGEVILKTIYTGDDAVPLFSLLPIINDHAAMVRIIEVYEKHIEVLPWDNQDDYGKIYRTKKLIGL